MATLTPQQQAAADAMINSTFNSLNPSVAEMYAGIYPSSTPQPTYQTGMLGRGQPADRLPSGVGSQAGGAYNTAGVPASSWYGTPGNYVPTVGANSGTMAYAGGSPQTPADPTNPATWGAFEQANYDAAHKPGTWMAQSRLQAQALMRQMAIRQQQAAAMGGAPKRGGGLASLLVGHGTPRQTTAQPGGLLGLLQSGYQPYNGRYTPQELAVREAQGQAIGDANRASPTPTHDVAGNNNAFMSTDHQNSVRWQTGY